MCLERAALKSKWASVDCCSVSCHLKEPLDVPTLRINEQMTESIDFQENGIGSKKRVSILGESSHEYLLDVSLFCWMVLSGVTG